jgi:hypothetical protein
MRLLGYTFALCLFLLATACSGSRSEDPVSPSTPPPTSRSYLVGVAPIPRFSPHSQPNDWLDVLGKIQDVAEVATAQSPWRDSSGSEGQIPEFIRMLGDQQSVYTFIPMMGINFFKQSGTYEPDLICGSDPANDWSNAVAQANYRDTALAIVKTYHPRYFALALEVNAYALAHPQDFQRFLDFYLTPGTGLYDSVKAASPGIQVFVTFQLEMMKGIGSWSIPVQSHWDLITRFKDKLDLVVFTTYPEVEAIYQTAEDLPSDYYSEIQNHVSRPIAFAELGWSASRPEEEVHQTLFISRFREMIQPLDPAFVNWIFMHDIAARGSGTPLDHTGLRYFDGSPKAAWQAWKSLRDLPRK